MKKLFKNGTMFIANAKMLEQVKDRFFKKGYTTLWGYVQEEYKDAKTVSSGYLHYDDKMFFLSQNTLDKPILSHEEFKIMVIEPKKPKNKNKKRYSENDLREAMEFGLTYGYKTGFAVGSFGDDGSNFEEHQFDIKEIFGDWLNDNK